MKRTLVIQVRSWHLVVGLFLLVALSGGTVLAAVGPNTFRPAGEFRIAIASDSVDKAVPSDLSDTVVLSKGITVPAGKTADLYASFTAEAYSSTQIGYTYAELRLDSATGTAFAPGEIRVLDNTNVYKPGAYALFSFPGYKFSLPAGAHTVYVTMDSSAGITLQKRTLTIVANIHD